MKFKQLANGLQVSLAGEMAQTSFRVSIPAQSADEAAKKVLNEASLYYDFKQQRAAVADNVEVPHAPSMLTDERYVFPEFRALSQSHLVSRGLDFTKPGVLEAAVPMLFGKTVYLNHEFTDVNDWVGVVSKSWWDAAGAKSNGIPGIGVQAKVDAYLNYRIACGLMMTPPAINAMSLTVLFEFEYSHPEMAIENKWKFFDNLGEEIDGDIVRLIVTRIAEIWEASFVYLGEDREARNHGPSGVAATGEDEESFSAQEAETAAGTPPNSNEERTMKLTTEQKKELGIEFDGEDVPETELLKAAESMAAKVKGLPDNVEELKAQAAAGATLVADKRAEVTRLAKLAELGADEGDLDEVVSGQIDAADANGLIRLESYFNKKVAERFPNGRSSAEDKTSVEAAGGVTPMAAAAPADGGLFS